MLESKGLKEIETKVLEEFVQKLDSYDFDKIGVSQGSGNCIRESLKQIINELGSKILRFTTGYRLKEQNSKSFEEMSEELHEMVWDSFFLLGFLHIEGDIFINIDSKEKRGRER